MSSDKTNKEFEETFFEDSEEIYEDDTLPLVLEKIDSGVEEAKEKIANINNKFAAPPSELSGKIIPPPVPKGLEDETKMNRNNGVLESFYDGVMKFNKLLSEDNSFYMAFKKGELTEHPRFGELVEDMDEYSFKIKLKEIERFNLYLDFNQDAFIAHKNGKLDQYFKDDTKRIDNLINTIFPSYENLEMNEKELAKKSKELINSNLQLVDKNKKLTRSNRNNKAIVAFFLSIVAMYGLTKGEFPNPVDPLYQSKIVQSENITGYKEAVVESEPQLYSDFQKSLISGEEFVNYVKENLFTEKDKVIFKVESYQDLAKQVAETIGQDYEQKDINKAANYLEQIIGKVDFKKPVYLAK